MNMIEHEKIAALIRYYEYCRQNFHARRQHQAMIDKHQFDEALKFCMADVSMSQGRKEAVMRVVDDFYQDRYNSADAKELRELLQEINDIAYYDVKNMSYHSPKSLRAMLSGKCIGDDRGDGDCWVARSGDTA